MAARTSKQRLGFTLAELLTVLAIITVLSALLFPVFLAARSAAHKTVCISNFKQVLMGTNLYLSDYDDRFMPVNYAPSLKPDPTIDKTWVQLLLPYTSNFKVFRCPVDPNQGPESEAVFDDDIVPGDTYARYYHASLRVNVGYNYLYFSPVYWSNDHWEVLTKSLSDVTDSAKATIFLDSAYARDARGNPAGGGSFVVIPPCRYVLTGNQSSDSFNVGANTPVFAASKGWDTQNPLSPFRYGYAWPWHDGRLTVARIAGGTAAMRLKELSAGCDVRPFWTGYIRDRGLYNWDLN